MKEIQDESIKVFRKTSQIEFPLFIWGNLGRIFLKDSREKSIKKPLEVTGGIFEGILGEIFERISDSSRENLGN